VLLTAANSCVDEPSAALSHTIHHISNRRDAPCSVLMQRSTMDISDPTTRIHQRNLGTMERPSLP